MSTLRDIRQLPDFQLFSNQLHRELKGYHCTVTLQSLQHLIAKSLGARSLESFQHISKRTPSLSETQDLQVQNRTKNWFILKNNDGTYWHYQDARSPTADANILIYSAQQAVAAATKANADGQNVCIVSFASAFPDCMQALHAPLEQLPMASFDAFSEEDWRDEVRRGDTSLSYAEWQLHQHENWCHEVDMYVMQNKIPE